MMRMVTGYWSLIGSLLLILLVTGARAEPSVWHIQGPHSNLYLVGTIHVGAANATLTPSLEQVYARSEQLWTEVDMRSVTPAHWQAWLTTHGRLPDTQTLNDLLSAEERARLARHLTAQQLDPAQVQAMRPWLAAITLQMAMLQQQGLTGQTGVDNQLTARASRDGKVIQGLETIDQQLQLFAALDTRSELDLLIDTLDDLEQSPESFAQLQSAWLAGDDAQLSAYLDAQRAAHPDWMAALTTQRNQRWLPKLLQHVQQGRGNVLVAVGALHLVGADGLVALLRAQGLRVNRLTPPRAMQRQERSVPSM